MNRKHTFKQRFLFFLIAMQINVKFIHELARNSEVINLTYLRDPH